jgi:carboxylate-amine ligase
VAYREPEFTVGIEEEYLLVDPVSRDLARNPSPEMIDQAIARIGDDGGQVTPEFLKSQIEVGTRICSSIAEASENLKALRRAAIDVAEEHGLALIAASTHPFAQWGEQQQTDKERYSILARDLQAVARRLVICGMHVHVGIDDDDLRVDLLSQASYFLPHLLALSTSSPFWQGRETGLKSYRIAVFDELPRTGLPEQFEGYGEYERHISTMIKLGIFEDASKLWWDIRASAAFPTVEMRITDVCTRIEDGICIAALYLCLMRMLYRLRRSNQRWRRYARMLLNENRWRAQRYGFDEGLIDFGKTEIVAYGELLEEMLELIAEDAEYFDCVEETRHAREILQRGTSAHWQLSTYQAAVAGGADPEFALRSVVDLLIAESRAGL